MKLSAGQFAELAATFDAQPGPKTTEKRRNARTELQAPVKITPFNTGRRLTAIDVTVCDFSTRGLAFYHTAGFDSNAQFILDLPRRDGGSVALLCTVIHSQSVENGRFRIRAEFTTCLEPYIAANRDA